jgi:hypothetical protein
MNIIIIGLIVLAIISAIAGLFMGFTDSPNVPAVRSDFLTLNAFIIAIFFLLLAIILKIY